MGITFDSSKIAMFRDTQFASANSIANLDEGGGLKADGKYRGVLGALFRSSAAQDRNNAVRTALLKSLGQAFGLDGITEQDGKVSFSKDFMDKLEGILGSDVLKRDDFKIAADGTVRSGRPLTSRRISAIMTKATVMGRGEFDAKDYSAKLGAIKEDIRIMNANSARNERLGFYFEHVGLCLEFLEKDFEGLIVENNEWIGNELSDKSNEGVARYVIKDPKAGPRDYKGIPMPTKGTLAKWIGESSSFNGLFHVELYKNIPREIKTEEDLNILKGYIRTTITLYVQSAIDLYLDAKEAGKLDQFIDAIYTDAGACMDAKASRPGEIRKSIGLFTEAEKAVEDVAEHDKGTNLDKCIYEEMRVANSKIPGGASGWEELAGAVKKALVGQVRPIMTLNKMGMIEPLVENGKQVVRAITEEDIDRLGPTCADILAIF